VVARAANIDDAPLLGAARYTARSQVKTGGSRFS
jgi:hypothetical protein